MVRVPQEVARQQAAEQLEKAEASRVVVEAEAAKQAKAARELGGQVEALKAQLVCQLSPEMRRVDEGLLFAWRSTPRSCRCPTIGSMRSFASIKPKSGGGFFIAFVCNVWLTRGMRYRRRCRRRRRCSPRHRRRWWRGWKGIWQSCAERWRRQRSRCVRCCEVSGV